MNEDNNNEKISAEEAFKKEQFLFNSLMNSLSDHVYFKDLDSKFILNNKAHANSFGLDDPKNVSGKTDFDFFTEEAARQAYDDEQTIIKTGHPIIKEEKLTRTDGSDVWFSAVKMPLQDNNGNIIGTFGISRDITERKKSEDALKHSEERLRSLTQSANDAIITTNSKGVIIGWNKGAENIFLFHEPDIIGHSISEIIKEDYVMLQIEATDYSESGKNSSFARTLDLSGIKEGGAMFPVEVSLSHWETSEGRFFTSIIRDISKRKRIELENQILYEITKGVTATSNLDELLALIHTSLSRVLYAENCFVALHNQRTGLFSFPYFVDKVDSTPLPTSMKKS